MPYLSVDGIRLYYDETGSGSPVLFIHGLGSSVRDWVSQVAHFSDQYRIIRVDLRGHGRSDRPRGPYHMSEFARDIAILLRKIDVAPAHVVGLSMGGMVAFQLAADAPQLVRSLFIVNSVADTRLHSWQDVWFYLSRRTAVQVLGMRRVGQIIARRLFVGADQEDLRQEFIRRWSKNDKQGYMWSVDAIMGWSIANDLSSISVPTHLVSAEHDYTPVSEKNRIVAEMPCAELTVVEDSRHALPVERPESFNSILESFLEREERRHAQCT